MKHLQFLFLVLATAFLIAPITDAKPFKGDIIAIVDRQFSYGFDVTWAASPKHLKHASLLSVEWDSGQYITPLNTFKVGFDGTVGIIYVLYTPSSITVPSGAIIRIIK